MFVIEEKVDEKGGMIFDANKIGMTAEFCLHNGTPRTVKCNGKNFYFSETVYNPNNDDVLYLKYETKRGKEMRIYNR